MPLSKLQQQGELLLDRVQNAEYLHLLLEPLPLYGFFFCFIFLSLGLLMKQPKTRVVSLGLLMTISLSTLPSQHQRELAHARTLSTREVQISKVRQVTQLRAKWRPAYLAFAALCFLALLVGSRFQFGMSYLVLIALLWLLPLSLWLHLKEAEAFHPNLMRLERPNSR